jgi:hypothetical protein
LFLALKLAEMGEATPNISLARNDRVAIEVGCNASDHRRCCAMAEPPDAGLGHDAAGTILHPAASVSWNWISVVRPVVDPDASKGAPAWAEFCPKPMSVSIVPSKYL